MRIPLFAFPYKVCPSRRMRAHWKGWRLRVYGLVLFEKCECDNAQGCLIVRDFPDSPYEDEDYLGCECRLQDPHRHSFVGQLVNKTLGIRWQ